jgi:hypothetical protein
MGIQDRDYMHERHRAQPRQSHRNRPQQTVSSKKFSGLLKPVIFFVMTIAISTLIIDKIKFGKTPINWTRYLPVLTKEISMPTTGDVTLYQQGHSTEAVASFSVVATSPGLKKISHLVKLVDTNTGQPVLTVFVRSGEIASIKVPLGSYKANIASGEKWYGDIKLFGNGTTVQQGNASLDFYRQGNSITGHTLTLAGTINGNFPTRELPADSF